MPRPRLKHATVVLTMDDDTKYTYLLEGDSTSECAIGEEHEMETAASASRAYVRQVPTGYVDVSFSLTHVRYASRTVVNPPKAVTESGPQEIAS